MTDNRLEPPEFDTAFREKLLCLFEWRRDVRRFLTDPVDPDLIEALLTQACLSPSVGNSQPWRFVLVEEEARRAEIRANFLEMNAAELGDYEGERAAAYATLKLAGLDKAPVHLAVFADTGTARATGLDAGPCRRRWSTRPLQRSIRCGWPPVRWESASAGYRSSIRPKCAKPWMFRKVGG